MCYDNNKAVNGVATKGQAFGSSEEEEESRLDDRHGNNANMSSEMLQISQDRVIRWERYLPFRSLKVLLVENDDSTRHIVKALLLNCSYEVDAVSNGLEAWRILEDDNVRHDLVLTEVSMPMISGIDLLCKITSHKTLENIPVIMMSSHDSMNLVFTCLSKGAADFLVKPIRKNELKNLWQHVWRRCHISSSSGSESGTHTRMSLKTEINEDSGTETSSSDEEEENGSSDQSICGTQSSWTKNAAEIENSPPVSVSCQLRDAQVIHMKPESYGREWVHFGEATELEDQNEQLDIEMEANDDGNSKRKDNVLRHSHLSAFSKYNTATSANKDPTGNIGSCSPNHSSVAKMARSDSTNNPLNQLSNNMVSSSKCENPKPGSFKKSHSSAFQTVQTARQTFPGTGNNNTSSMLDKIVIFYSGTGSASRSNNGKTVITNACPNGETDKAGDGIGNRRREAALLKFRQKRKDRCF